MTITNIVLILVVVAIAGYVVYHSIKKKQTAEVEVEVDVDDKTYTIEKMIEFVKKRLDEIVEKSLRGAALFDEVKDRLKKSALGLSGGQQQRLCIARTIAVSPEIILMDEPTSALDPISTNKMEELMDELKKQYTVVIVTHNMQQAGRIADKTAFFLSGEVIEYGKTEDIFYRPKDKRTEDYITGRFG